MSQLPTANQIIAPAGDLATPVPRRRIDLIGAQIDALTESQTVQLIMSALRAGQGGWVITANLDQLRLFRKLPDVRLLYGQAQIVLADGMPLVWAGRLQKTPLPERVTGSGLIFSLTAAAAAEGRSVFLLGGNPGTADAAAAVFKSRYPTVNVTGTCCPPFGFDTDPHQLELIRRQLVAAKPDIVYVGLGFPKQERLIAQIRLDLPAAWFLGIGISLSMVCGQVKRAPVWMQRAGLEWLYRMAQEPLRLFRRYILLDMPFAARLFLSAIGRRLRRRAP